MAELSFSRRTGSERDIQPVAIVAVDASTRMATGVTRTRHSIQINCAYATGDTITIPASGEQWYVERFDMEWRLYGRIPFNDATLNIAPEEGQVSIGSASGPLELNGTEVRANGETLRLNGVYFRDTGEQFERSTDKVNWTPVAAGLAGLVELIANALTGYEGVSQTDAVQALKDWASLIQEILDSFWLFWTQMCENIFVNGLKRLGVGETDLEKIVNGLQNFVNYAFSLIFCDFTGDLTPQTFLARLRDLLAPLQNNPFILGFQTIAEILEVSVGNLLNDAVAGASALVELMFNIITCNWEDIDLGWIEGIIGLVGEDTPFSPANIFKFIVGLIEPLMTNPFALGLMAIAEALGKEVSGLLDGAITGGMEFIRFLFDLLFCQVDPAELTAVLGVAGTAFTPAFIVKAINDFFQFFRDNPFLTGLQDFLGLVGETTGNLLQDAVAGATEFASLVVGVIFCDPDKLEQLGELVEGILPGIGDPMGILRLIYDKIISPILNNPLAMLIKGFAETVLGIGGGLLNQILVGSGDLINWVLKIIKTIIPLGTGVWSTLLPFVDWDAVDEADVNFPDLGDVLAGFDPFELFLPLQQFFNNLTSLLGLDFLDEDFNPLTAIGDFLTHVGSDLNDWLQTTLGGFFTNLTSLFGLDFLDEDFDPLTAASDFLTHITADLYDWVKANVMGGFNDLSAWFTGTILDPLEGVGGDISEFLESMNSWAESNIFSPLRLMITGNSEINLTTFFDNIRGLLGVTAPGSAFGATSLVAQVATAILGSGFTSLANLTTFFTRLRSLFGATNFMGGTFNPVTVVEDFIKTRLDPAKIPLLNTLNKLDVGFLPTLTASMISDLSGWVQTNIIGPIATALLGAGYTTISNITTFFTRLRQIFAGVNFMGGSFNPVDAARALIELVLNPNKVPTLDDDDELPVSTIKGITDFVNSNVIRPIVTTLLLGSGLDLTKFGINTQEDLDNVDIGVLGDLAGSLLTSLGNIPADLLTGLIPPAILGVVPVSNISDTSPNLLLQGSFADSISVEDNDNWFWDSTTNMAGSIGGSAKTVISPAKNRYLYSRQAIPVAVGDRIRLNGFVKTTGLTVSPGGSTPISIALIPFIRNSSGATEAQTPVVIGTQLGSSTNWTNIGQSSTTHYEVTNASWVYVVVRLGVASTATAGTVWWDAISLKKVGLLTQTKVDSLIDAWNAAIGGLTNPGGGPATGQDWTGLFAAAAAARGQANTGVTNAGIAQTAHNTLSSQLSSSPHTRIGNIASVVIDGSSSMGTLLSNLVAALSSSSMSGATAAQVQAAASAFRGLYNTTNTNFSTLNSTLFAQTTPGSVVRKEALPITAIGAALTTTGSGAILKRTSTAAQAVSTANSGRNVVPSNFFNSVGPKSADITVRSGNTGFSVQYAGWYMVELAYRLNGVASWGWSFAPLLYVNGSPSKMGTECLYTWGGNIGGAFSSGVQRNVQNSFIVYLATGQYVDAGYAVTMGANFGDTNVLGGSGGGSGVETYFSISLLNRSYA